MKQKLRSRAGVSMLEMLAAMLILVLVAGGMVTAVTLANRQYVNSMRQSEANTLSSTVRTILTDELGYASRIWVDENGHVVKFLSRSYQDPDWASTIATDAEDGGYGHLIYKDLQDDTRSRELLSRSAYPNNLGACVDSVTYADGLYTVELRIGCGEEEYLAVTFQILAVNTPTIESA